MRFVTLSAATGHPWRLDLSSAAALAAAIGTFALALFTAWLAWETKKLASSDDKRRKQEARGAARLVVRELDVTLDYIELARRDGAWMVAWPTPHAAWDRSGGVLAEALPEMDAATVIDGLIAVTSWEALVSAFLIRAPDRDELPLQDGSAQETQFTQLQMRSGAAREVLKSFGNLEN